MNKDKTKREDRIKVLRVIARLNIGGPAIHVILLTSGLNKERFASQLVTGTVSEGEGDIAYTARGSGIEPFIIPELKRDLKLNNDITAFLKLYRLMRKLKPDIVHTHTAKAGALGRLAAIMNKVPIRIHTFHGHVFHSYFGRFRTRIFITIEKILAKFTDRIVVISQNQLKDVRDTYRIARGDKFSVIPLGLNLGPFMSPQKKDGIRKRLLIDEETLLVGIVGRLTEVKNHRMFLKAAERVRQLAPGIKVRFLIVGDGKLKQSLEAYANELGLKDFVIFAGWTGNIETVYKDLDVICLTSLNEGTPISLIEAMASGKAVIATDVGGVRDVVIDNETGLLSPSGDTEGFARNLLSLLADADRRKNIGEKARASVYEKFSGERLLKDMESLYEEELAKRRIN